uniref:CSON006898 protein n=1 Tax=Culicoides sonorensis TaxID=179676 RepID=A0A336LZT6_CULSO
MQKLIVFCTLLTICFAGDLDKDATILTSEQEVNYDGTYKYRYETSNGIFGEESGVGGQASQGQARWVSPEGEQVQLSYTADENGYQPVGNHLPTPPPTPDYILKALEFIANNPPHPDTLINNK